GRQRRRLHRSAVQYRQRAGQAEAHRAHVGIGRVAEPRGAAAEDLGAREQLHVHLQADHRLVAGGHGLGLSEVARDRGGRTGRSCRYLSIGISKKTGSLPLLSFNPETTRFEPASGSVILLISKKKNPPCMLCGSTARALKLERSYSSCSTWAMLFPCG